VFFRLTGYAADGAHGADPVPGNGLNMTTVDKPFDTMPEMAPSEVSEIWLGHLMSLLIPLTALAYVWTGPHVWYNGLLFITPLAIFTWMDSRPRYERRQPVETLPSWPFDLLVYLVVAIHFLILAGLVRLFSEQSFFSIDTVMVFVLVGGNSGFSIITAHELIHRQEPGRRLLGRLLLSTVLYEHFYTEHLRGHHVRVGTPEDPATAHFGETYRSFWRRTVPAQFRSAWRLEARRLGDSEMSLFDPRVLGNRVLHGIAVGWGIAFAVLFFFGPVAFFAYVLQAFVAVRLLEAVNYFEHWGLKRKGSRVHASDSWDTYSWFTYYGLIGLSRHADHHAQPMRPYQQLRVREDAPVLPVGYLPLIDMVLGRNADFMELATAELKARGLGPFASESDEAIEIPVPRPSGAARFWAGLSPWLQWPVFLGGLLLLISTGAALEGGQWGDLQWGDFQGIAIRNGAIMGIIAAVLAVRYWVETRVQNGWISWGCGLMLLFGVGALSLPWLGV